MEKPVYRQIQDKTNLNIIINKFLFINLWFPIDSKLFPKENNTASRQ